MGSSSNFDFENLSLFLAHDSPRAREEEDNEPTPYTFTKFENGKKTVIDPTTIVPPSWLLLDHTIAVVWFLFGSKSSLPHLNIHDLKWAYEFLREVRDSTGENPPDVKACLNQIQDRLIELYARLMNVRDDYFDQFTNSFGESLFNDTKTLALSPRRIDSKQLDKMSPSTIRVDYPLHNRHSSRDLTMVLPKTKKLNHSKNGFLLMSKNSNIFDDSENEDFEKYFQKLLDDDKDEDVLQSKLSSRSFALGRRVVPDVSISEILSGPETEKTKRVHCVAEMQSLQYQKSTKFQDMNGDEAAFSNLKAEVKRLVFNPRISKPDVLKLLSEWKNEQADKLNNEFNRLHSIEEMIKYIDEGRPNADISQLDLRE